MKKYPLCPAFRKADVILALTAALLIWAFVQLNMPFGEIFTTQTALSQGYIAREGHGSYYILDNGHSRLFRLDRSGKIIFEVNDPTGSGEISLYIDDFYIAPDGLYLAASEWNGMLLDREVILEYTPEGEYVRTAVELDYTGESALTNKHRIYGVCLRDGLLTWAECRDDHILLHFGSETAPLSYPDAFNAVSDLVFDGRDPVILGKNGTIRRFRSGGAQDLIYSTAWAGEEDRIPFRIALYSGRVAFTDIRSGQAAEADPAAQCARVIMSGTGSQTVTFSSDGESILLVDADGMLVHGSTDTRFSALQRPDRQLLHQGLFLAVCVFLAVCAVFLLIRLAVLLSIVMRGRFHGLSLTVVAVVLLVGVVISTILLNSFRSAYLNKIKEQLQTSARIVASNISTSDLDGIQRAEDFGGEAYESLLHVMVQAFPMDIDFCRTAYCNILRMDESHENGWGIAYLDQSIGVYFPLDEVETKEARMVYESGTPVWDDAVADVTGTYLSVKVPVTDRNGEVAGVVAVGADTFVVDEMVGTMQQDILLSIAVIVLLIWVICTETISFIGNRTACIRDRETLGERAFPGHLVRLLVFCVFAAFNLVSSFLPVFILKSCSIFPETGRELAASLPMTVNIFMIGFMSLFCAGAVRRMGMKKVLAVSICFSMCGNLALVFFPGYIAIVAGLILDGIGVGLITNAVYVLLTYIPDEKSRTNGFSIYNTASLSGINFGMIVGSLLAVRIGQRQVFLAAALLWAALLMFSAFLLRRLDGILSPSGGSTGENKERIRAGGFLRQKSIWSFIVLIQNPYILFSSFVFFFVPIFCESMGYNETFTAAFLMLYSETAVLLGGGLSEHMEQSAGGRSMYIALGLNVAGVLIFALTRSVPGLLAALFLMGVSAAFGKPCQQAYYLRQAPSVRFGEDRAMGVYNFSENIGESLGPVVWGAILAGGANVIYVFLAAVSALGGMHYSLNRNEARKTKNDGIEGTDTL